MKIQKIFGLVGASLGHSFSKKYFSEKFDKEALNYDYLNFELKCIEDIKPLLLRNDLGGLNVTIPYKESVISFLDEITEQAQRIGAVNTIQFINGKTIGHNTDVFGFKQLIKPFFESQHERAIILGTGGAAKAVAFVLEEIGASVIYISRNPKTENEFAYSDMNAQMLDSCKLIVNTTPIGTFPNINDCPNIPFEFLTPKHLVVDLIYNPEKTKFLQESAKMGAWIINGKTMLEQQAEKSWEIWNI